MAFQIVKKWATIGCVALVAVVGLTQYGRAQNSGYASFYCGTHGGQPATVARLPQSNGSSISRTLIVWEINIIKGYPPQKRCNIVSQKFQENQNSGDLRYIVSGVFENLPVLCASQEKYSYVVNCADPNVLMTLLPGDDSQAMIKKLGALNKGASVDPPRHQGADEVLVETGDLVAIDVDKMLLNSPETSECLFWGCD